MEPQINRVLPQNMTIICGFLEVNHIFVNPKNKIIMKKSSLHPAYPERTASIQPSSGFQDIE